jgi:hypothetical protein
LLADLGVLHSYFVTQKGGFDTISLLAYGENLFPPELASKVRDALFDAREAGKCLAFELPTACGFHIFRATESVLRKYYMQVTNSTIAPKVRNIGVYLNARPSLCSATKITSISTSVRFSMQAAQLITGSGMSKRRYTQLGGLGGMLR